MSNGEMIAAAAPEAGAVVELATRKHEMAAKGLSTWSAGDLIRYAKENPPEPLLEGLLYLNDILLIHGPEESFKSMFVVQIAESIALGQPLLRRWKCRKSRKVGVVETEMHPAMLGERLGKMFPDGNAPENLVFMPDETLREWRRKDLQGKIRSIGDWIAKEHIEVPLIDTANDFFRGADNPQDERSVGSFFDGLRNQGLGAWVLIRHDRKKKEIDAESHSNELIRGSAEWKEDPETILHIKRADKRTHEVLLDVGKLRYGSKPEPIQAWFDAAYFRLTPLPPVIAILEHGEKTRQRIVRECQHRFGVETRSTDFMIEAQRKYLIEEQRGHEVSFRLHPERSLEAEWSGYLTFPGA